MATNYWKTRFVVIGRSPVNGTISVSHAKIAAGLSTSVNPEFAVAGPFARDTMGLKARITSIGISALVSARKGSDMRHGH
jgi:hypothetical protein